MKSFAYYLPQFHCIPENDLWWGKGFTEWTNVKKAKPLYKGHVQPRHPLNNNYYNLNDVETLKWQSSLMNSYGIDGLIFYHYYFNGKKLLEKPAEMLLKNKDIKIPFFFCWANHSWIRSWKNSKELLIEQKYGEENDWEEHFNYLLPFFKDSRYEKKDNKPIFMVYKPDFKEKEDMFKLFNKKCKENGFNGICIIETRDTYNIDKIEKSSNVYTEYTKYIHLREPSASINSYRFKLVNLPQRIFGKIMSSLNIFGLKFLRKYNGNILFKLMYKNNEFNKNVIRGLFFEWDNTPRHSYNGYIILPPNKETFMTYMDSIKDNEYVFINAWNEWCEGMILEPTEEDGYKYLEWLKEWKDKQVK